MLALPPGDPVQRTLETVNALPELDRLRLLALLLLDMDEDGNARYLEFRERLIAADVSPSQREEVYQVFGQAVPTGESQPVDYSVDGSPASVFGL